MACGSSLIWLLNLNLNFVALYTGFNFKGGKTRSALFGRPNNSCAINVSLIKDYPLRCKDFHSLDLGFYILSVDKALSEKVEALIRSITYI